MSAARCRQRRQPRQRARYALTALLHAAAAASATLLEPWPLARQPRARQKPACTQICHHCCKSCQHGQCTALHRTAQHRTARQTAPRNAFMHTVLSLPCSHRACAVYLSCHLCCVLILLLCHAAGGSQRLGALGACGSFAQGSR